MMTKQEKLDLFIDFTDLCEEKGFSTESQEFSQISAFALKDGPVAYASGVKSLLDIDVDNISDKELITIVKRARTGLKRLLELKTRYSAGPFFSSRKYRRIADRRKNRAAKRTSIASKIVKDIKESKSELITLPPAM